MRGYLLSIAELFSDGDEYLPVTQSVRREALPERNRGQKEGDGLLARAFARVDSSRREKAARMRPGRGQAASLGAGLLLQLAASEAMELKKGLRSDTESREPAPFSWKRYSIRGLLERLGSVPPVPLCYTYGDRGKPYLKDSPFCFSISHSGEYVLCAVAGEEIGADIQQHRSCNGRKLADRFFSERERAVLEQAFRDRAGEEEFFRLWVRKEAYGKLTGGGIGDVVGRNLLPGEEELTEGRGLIWEETPKITGYSMAVCRYRNQIMFTGSMNDEETDEIFERL